MRKKSDNERMDYLIDKTNDMLDADSELGNMYLGIDDMWHGYWSAPEELKNKPDFRETIDMSPHDALKAGTTIMSTSLPHWKVQPLNSSLEELSRAEKIEYALDWHFKRMNQRGTGSLQWDIVHSALRYDAIAVWLDYLPYWKDTSKRAQAVLRKGPYIGTAYSPRFVHTQKDTYGLSTVLHATNKSAQEVANNRFWREGADPLLKKLKEDKDTGTARFNLFDMMYWEDDVIKRVVWGDITDSTTLEVGEGKYKLWDGELDMPFMPWIIRIGGTNLESESKYSVHPLLAPLYWTHAWKDQNIYESLTFSEIIKYARSPRVKTKTPSGEGVDIDYADSATLDLRMGQEEAEAWKPAPIDPNLTELVDRNRAKISSATLPKILQNPEFAGNTPFASMNAMMQSAIGTLNTSKVLCEGAFEEIGVRMLEWAKFNKDPLLAFRETTMKTGEIEAGAQVIVSPDDYDMETVIVKTTLATEIPTDFMQRLNAAVLMNQQLKYPRSEALEDLGKENADVLFDQWAQEQYDASAIQNDIMSAQTLAQGEAQLKIKQAELAMTQQAQAQAQPPQVPEGQPPQGGGYPSNTQGYPMMENLKGQGYNQGAGGMSPATGSSGVSTREQITGTDRTGLPIP